MFDIGSKKFESRQQVGQLLARKLKKFSENAVVLAIPRGGVVIGAEIAKHLKSSAGYHSNTQNLELEETQNWQLVPLPVRAG